MSEFKKNRQLIKDKAKERKILIIDIETCEYDDTMDMTGARNVITKVNGEINL